MEAHLCVRNNRYLIFVRNFQKKWTGTPFRFLKKEPERRSGAFRSNSNPDWIYEYIMYCNVNRLVHSVISVYLPATDLCLEQRIQPRNDHIIDKIMAIKNDDEMPLKKIRYDGI